MSSVQNHITINFPLKSHTDAAAIKEELPPLMPDFAKVQGYRVRALLAFPALAGFNTPVPRRH